MARRHQRSELQISRTLFHPYRPLSSRKSAAARRDVERYRRTLERNVVQSVILIGHADIRSGYCPLSPRNGTSRQARAVSDVYQRVAQSSATHTPDRPEGLSPVTPKSAQAKWCIRDVSIR